MTVYAIGDIHGQLTALRAAHDRVEADRAREGTRDATLIHVGDLVDRGPDSAGVVERLADLARRDPRVVTLKGNHDALFLQFLEERPPLHRAFWLQGNMGGWDTLASYGVPRATPPSALYDRANAALPPAHRQFLTDLPRSHAAGACLFVHAGIRPGVPLAQQDPEDLIWIRDPFLSDTRDHGPLVVHGHTPTDAVEHHGNRLAIDTGAGYGRPLSAVVIEGRDAFLLTEAGRVPVERLG